MHRDDVDRLHMNYRDSPSVEFNFRPPVAAADEITLTLNRPDKNVRWFDHGSERLQPQKRSKDKAKFKRFEEITIRFPEKVLIDNIKMTPDGRRLEVIGRQHFLSIRQEHLRPASVDLSGYYKRGGRKKILFQYSCVDSHPPGNIHWAMRGWYRFYAVDTNTRMIDGQRVSICCVVQGYVMDTVDGLGHYKVDTYQTEAFINLDGNPETHGICLLISTIAKRFRESPNLQFGIITDSELGLIDGYNARTTPLQPGYYLPKNFHMMYATADAGRDTFMPNKLMAIADQAASTAFNGAKVVTVG